MAVGEMEFDVVVTNFEFHGDCACQDAISEALNLTDWVIHLSWSEVYITR